jgi:hypothetical protein
MSQTSPEIEALNYLGAIRIWLEKLYAVSADNPRTREHLSDEIDWVDAEMERRRGHAQRQQQLQEAVAAAHAAFEAIPIGYPLQQNGRTIDHTLLNEAKRLCELAVSDTSTLGNSK